MAWIHEFVIRSYMNLERVALETFKSGLNNASPQNYCRCGFGVVVFIGILALEMGYYYFHAFQSDQDEELQAISITLFSIDIIALITFMTFPLAAPLHRALGYFDTVAVDPITLQTRISDLMNDSGAKMTMNFALVMIFLYVTGDVLYWSKHFPWEAVPVYTGFVVLTMITMYGALLITILSMKAILCRLTKIEDQVDDILCKTDPSDYHTFTRNNDNENGDGSEGSDSADIARGWAEAYRSIRRDVHDMCEHFGVRLLLGIFLFIVDTTSLVAVAWEDLGERMTILEATSLLFCFTANSLILTCTLFNMAFLVTTCNHHIGPKISVLSVRNHEEVPQFMSVASMFLHAPVKIHVGNFEVSPEYANAIGLWFLGLFLVVFGLKIPGME